MTFEKQTIFCWILLKMDIMAFQFNSPNTTGQWILKVMIINMKLANALGDDNSKMKGHS